MKRFLLALALVVFGATSAHAVTCTITGQLLDAANNPVANAVIQFNSLVTQTVAGVTIPATLMTTSTDNAGNIQGFAVQQGLSGQAVICNPKAGGCGTPTPILIPVAGTAVFSDILSGTAISSGNGTVGNLTVTGHVSINATDCSAITLAQGIITSNPPGNDMSVVAGAHCTGGTTQSWIADADSAVIFANFVNGSLPSPTAHNAGWQWLGNTGLTPGNVFTPALLMSLADNPSTAPTSVTHNGILTTNSLNLQNGSTTALQFAGGSIVSLTAPSMNLAAGAHWNGGAWVADATSQASVALNGNSVVFTANSGLTPGVGFAQNVIATGTSSGWQLNGANPVTILQSTTNIPADILQVLPQNLTQGIGIFWDEIHSIGTAPAISMGIDAKGGGALILQSQNASGIIQSFTDLQLVNSKHLLSNLGGGNPPTLGPCGVGATITFGAGSTDMAGSVFISGGSVNSCFINFGIAYPATPRCVVQASTASPNGAIQSTVSTTTINFVSTGGILANGEYHWICIGN